MILDEVLLQKWSHLRKKRFLSPAKIRLLQMFNGRSVRKYIVLLGKSLVKMSEYGIALTL